MSTAKRTKYFKKTESKETLTGIYKDNLSIEQRSYTYSTGAVYNGEWRGGMRHGRGTIVWVDGAKYEGELAFNAAAGNGKFTHAEGDVYEGHWKNN